MSLIDNEGIAKVLSEIAVYLEMDSVPFKPRAYEKAAEGILGLGEKVAEMYKRGGFGALLKIPGVGKGIAEKIEELVKTGKLGYYDHLRKKMPVDISSLNAIEGIGPKHIKKLYEELQIKNVADLEKAAKTGKIKKLPHFGAKSEEKILKGIEFLKKSGRFVLARVIPAVLEIRDRLAKLKEVQKIDIAGSIRRGKETVGDADILIVSKKSKTAMDFFVKMPEVAAVIARGHTKSAVRLKNGLDIDVRVVEEKSYGAALNYFTGSKDHNVALRELAIKKGWKLSEYGLFKTSAGKEAQIAGKTEEEIYKKLGLIYIPPELREMRGEIEAARSGGLPNLIRLGDLQGDLQVQTNWTDGKDSIENMARAAAERGLRYIAITDHTKRLAMTRGLDEKRMRAQWKEIDAVNSKLKRQNLKFKILKGTECDILPDGSLDLPDRVLCKLDVAGVSVHSLFNMQRKDQTKRIKRAMSNPYAHILFHPTGRLINEREPYDIDIDEIIQHAKKTGTILEIDAYPERSDLKDEHIKKCVEGGVKMSIDSDAHSASHFRYLENGIMQARRGWVEKKDIINAFPADKMLAFLK